MGKAIVATGDACSDLEIEHYLVALIAPLKLFCTH
jgi:hypothetical protein